MKSDLARVGKWRVVLIGKKIGLLLLVPVLFGLSGCTRVGIGPPPPVLTGPNPFLDRILIFIGIAIIVIVAEGIFFIVYKNLPARRISKYSPKEIAQARYASGELSRDEYLTIMRDLEDSDITEREERGNHG